MEQEEPLRKISEILKSLEYGRESERDGALRGFAVK